MINKNKELMDGSRGNQPPQMRGRLVDNLRQIEKTVNFKPGQISKELRDALGVRDDELPPYIDKMWMHGYPPGYQKLKVSSSGSFYELSSFFFFSLLLFLVIL
jgi:hypothetical protein